METAWLEWHGPFVVSGLADNTDMAGRFEQGFQNMQAR
jgi:hypothetical protein